MTEKNKHIGSEDPLTIREKIVVRLVLFVIQMLEPYQYEHQFKEWAADMRALIVSKGADDE